MIEWWQNERYLRIQFFLPLQKHPHSSSFCHSFVISESLEWQGMKITMERYHSSVILLISNSFQSVWNDGMRGNEGIFLNKGKTLNSEIHLIPQSFRHSNVIQVEVNFKFIPCRRYTACVQKTLIGCCLLRGDSTRLNHSEVISLSFQTHLE